ncbi:MAG: guanylate kinase [Rhodocyclaceae bacterium]|jgi:guanylate kinase|nr:guanylate kinase [Zoogloeaceae bacterium]MBP9654018.1 guanylate kinase [Rhodocyclaceae bacterium]OQY74430.1 MAG: guanylate kinase [Rhodocyclaceae bacterium UTPRO2]HNQ58510.1 guanylate kinase [Candidatus Desulfobacillus denitrificans]MCQ3925429.1 guanylate kinase [Rhodocyclaceae bacterium]
MPGNLFIVAAPSGAGKTTLVRMLLERDGGIRLSISYTTRAPRPGEADGREYHFIDVPAFHAMRENGDFLESAEVHGNFYGTSRPWILEQMAAGQDVLLEIDWQGAQQVRGLFHGSIGIFVLPPSVEELERRLRGRGQDSDEIIARRVAAALSEMRHVNEFDYVIINNKLPEAIEDLQTVVRAVRLRTASQLARHRALFSFLEQES